MIFPGHVAASVLCHRYLRADLRLALVAGFTPDLVDKTARYVLQISSGSRIPSHTLGAWAASTALVAGISWMHGFCAARGKRPGGSSAWRVGAYTWFVAYGAHLLCDSPLLGGKLPFLWPWQTYGFAGPRVPLAFLFGLDDWPIGMLAGEGLLVAFTVYTEWRRRKRGARQVGPAAAQGRMG